MERLSDKANYDINNCSQNKSRRKYHSKATCVAVSWPNGARAIGRSRHSCRFRTVHCFWDSGTIFAISTKLREWITSGHYIIIKSIYIMYVTFFADLNLSRIVRNLISHPSQVL